MFLSNGFVRILTNFSRIFVFLHTLVIILITSKEVVSQSVSSAKQEFVILESEWHQRKWRVKVFRVLNKSF